MPQYAANLRQIVERIRKETSATLIFSSTTPILDEWHARRKADFDRLESDVQRYNQAALQVMKDADITVNDLHSVVEKAGSATLMTEDGTHYSPEGFKRLAEAVIMRTATLRAPGRVNWSSCGSPGICLYPRTSITTRSFTPGCWRFSVDCLAA